MKMPTPSQYYGQTETYKEFTETESFLDNKGRNKTLPIKRDKKKPIDTSSRRKKTVENYNNNRPQDSQ